MDQQLNAPEGIDCKNGEILFAPVAGAIKYHLALKCLTNQANIALKTARLYDLGEKEGKSFFPLSFLEPTHWTRKNPTKILAKDGEYSIQIIAENDNPDQDSLPSLHHFTLSGENVEALIRAWTRHDEPTAVAQTNVLPTPIETAAEKPQEAPAEASQIQADCAKALAESMAESKRALEEIFRTFDQESRAKLQAAVDGFHVELELCKRRLGSSIGEEIGSATLLRTQYAVLAEKLREECMRLPSRRLEQEKLLARLRQELTKLEKLKNLEASRLAARPERPRPEPERPPIPTNPPTIRILGPIPQPSRWGRFKTSTRKHWRSWTGGMRLALAKTRTALNEGAARWCWQGAKALKWIAIVAIVLILAFSVIACSWIIGSGAIRGVASAARSLTAEKAPLVRTAPTSTPAPSATTVRPEENEIGVVNNSGVINIGSTVNNIENPPRERVSQTIPPQNAVVEAPATGNAWPYGQSPQATSWLFVDDGYVDPNTGRKTVDVYLAPNEDKEYWIPNPERWRPAAHFWHDSPDGDSVRNLIDAAVNGGLWEKGRDGQATEGTIRTYRFRNRSNQTIRITFDMTPA